MFDYPCDRLATDRSGAIYCASVFGHSTAMKALFAFLNTTAKGHVEILEKHRLGMTIEKSTGARIAPKEFTRFETWGYRIYREKKEFGLWHCAVCTRSPNFMPCISDEALWQALMQPQFTTPLIPEWIPYIRENLTASGKLKETYGFQAKCGFLVLKTKELDEIVCTGLQNRSITIPGD